MAQFDWKNFFHQHPIFASLTEVETERLLDAAISQERHVPKGETIVREGDLGASLFVIGTGATIIKVSGPGGTLIPLVTLQTGDFFGEMALLQHLPRAATVAATEQTLLREIQGEPFLQMLQQHPDIEFRMLLVLSERLRRVGQQIVSIAHKDVDRKLQAFDAKLEAALKQFDTRLEADLRATNASLLASQTVFEQTSKRADEVITSAERRQANQSRIFAAIGTGASVLVGIGAFFGISAYKDIQNISDLEAKTEERAVHVEQLTQNADAAATKIQAQAGSINNTEELMRTAVRLVLEKNFVADVKSDSGEAVQTFTALTRFHDPLVRNQIFIRINQGILNSDARPDFRKFIEATLDPHNSIAPDDAVILYSFLLSSMVLGNELGDYELKFPEFSAYVRAHRGSQVSQRLQDNFHVEAIKNYIDQSDYSDDQKSNMKKKIDEIFQEVVKN
jgi:CRP-like cAMP-binding protein